MKSRRQVPSASRTRAPRPPVPEKERKRQRAAARPLDAPQRARVRLRGEGAGRRFLRHGRQQGGSSLADGRSVQQRLERALGAPGHGEERIVRPPGGLSGGAFPGRDAGFRYPVPRGEGRARTGAAEGRPTARPIMVSMAPGRLRGISGACAQPARAEARPDGGARRRARAARPPRDAPRGARGGPPVPRGGARADPPVRQAPRARLHRRDLQRPPLAGPRRRARARSRPGGLRDQRAGRRRVALQEVLRPFDEPDPLEQLAEALQLHLAFVTTRVHRRGEIGNAILSRWPITSVFSLDLSFSRVERRSAVAVQFSSAGVHAGRGRDAPRARRSHAAPPGHVDPPAPAAPGRGPPRRRSQRVAALRGDAHARARARRGAGAGPVAAELPGRASDAGARPHLRARRGADGDRGPRQRRRPARLRPPAGRAPRCVSSRDRGPPSRRPRPRVHARRLCELPRRAALRQRHARARARRVGARDRGAGAGGGARAAARPRCGTTSASRTCRRIGRTTRSSPSEHAVALDCDNQAAQRNLRAAEARAAAVRAAQAGPRDSWPPCAIC